MSGQNEHLDKEKVRQALRKIASDLGSNQPFAWATVKSVDEVSKTAVCVDKETDLEYYDVLLGLGSMIPVPVKNTTVLVGLTSPGGESSFILWAEELESVKIKIGSNELKLDDQGIIMHCSPGKYEIKNDQEDLKKLLQDLINEITLLTVTTPMGNSGVPINKLQFQVLAQRISKLFK